MNILPLQVKIGLSVYIILTVIVFCVMESMNEYNIPRKTYRRILYEVHIGYVLFITFSVLAYCLYYLIWRIL